MRFMPIALLKALPLGTRRGYLGLLAAALVAFSAAAAGCSDDDDDEPDATSVSGALATATPGSSTQAPGVNSAPGGTLIPAAPTDTPAPTVNAPPQNVAGTAAMLDMAPCADEDYFELQTFAGGVPAITYRGVPEGTPIVFPFEAGELVQADAREGAIVLVYRVDDVGVFTVQAAGTDTLDRLVARPVAGTVIGQFGREFGDEETDAFQGYQLFAVAGTTELVAVGDQFHAGEPLNLEVKDCVVLP